MPNPSYNSEGFLGWAPATPSFFAHRSLVWLFAGAPFRFVVVQAPCQNLFVVGGIFVGSSEQAKRACTAASMGDLQSDDFLFAMRHLLGMGCLTRESAFAPL